jgi:hypothetical protein
LDGALFTVEVDIDIEFLVLGPSTSATAAFSAVDLDLVCFVYNRRGRRWWRRRRGWCRRAGSDNAVINVSVVRDDLLNNGGTNFWLWHWRRRRRRRRWRRRGCGSPLFFASNDDLVSYNFSVVLGRGGLGAWTADDKLLTFSCDQVASIACGRRKTLLAATPNSQGAPFSARVSAITAELAAVCLELELAIVLLEADGAPLSRNVSAVAAEFAARSLEIDTSVASAAASEAYIFVVVLGGGAADRPDWGAVTTTENNVVALRGTPRLLATSDGDVGLVYFSGTAAAAAPAVVAVISPHGRGWRGTAANGADVIVKTAAGTAGSCPREVVFVAASYNHLPGSRAVVVVTEEIGGAAPSVRAADAATQLLVKLVIVAVAAVAAAAIEVALSLFIELSGGVASRHCAGKRQVSDGGAIRGVG